MPPKGWKKYADGFKPATSQGTPAKERQSYPLDKLLMPRSVVTRIAKSAVDDQSLPKDGVTALQRSATIFINYIANQANKNCQKQGRRILTVQDVQYALESLGFGAFWGEIETVLKDAAAADQIKAASKQSKDSELPEGSQGTESQEAGAAESQAKTSAESVDEDAMDES